MIDEVGFVESESSQNKTTVRTLPVVDATPQQKVNQVTQKKFP